MTDTDKQSNRSPESYDPHRVISGAVDIVEATVRSQKMDAASVPAFLEQVYSGLKTMVDKATSDPNFEFSVPGVMLGGPVQSGAHVREAVIAPFRRPEALPAPSPAPVKPAVATKASAVKATPAPAADRTAPEKPTVKSAPKASASKRVKPKGRPKGELVPKGVEKVDDSIQHEYLICMEDGRRVRDLADHLLNKHDMTPEGYRAKWGLPAAYPMMAPAQIFKRGTVFEVNPKTGALVRGTD